MKTRVSNIPSLPNYLREKLCPEQQKEKESNERNGAERNVEEGSYRNGKRDRNGRREHTSALQAAQDLLSI